MSKADISTTPILARRAVLAGVASAAVLPIVAGIPASSAATTDPIFAAIEAFHRADAEFMGFEGGDIPDELGNRQSDAYEVVLRTRPTTLAGLAALTTLVRELAAWLHESGSLLDSEDLYTLCASIDDATRCMSAA